METAANLAQKKIFILTYYKSFYILRQPQDLRKQVDLNIGTGGGEMTKDDLVTEVVKICKGDDLSKRLVSDIIDATFASIGKSIKKEKRFSYPAFGTFTVRNRKARIGRNPQTGAEIKIKASKTVGFKPAPTLKSSL